MRVLRPGWYWPLHHFWTFTPWGWALAVVWNISEAMGLACPKAGEVFGIIIGCKGVKK